MKEQIISLRSQGFSYNEIIEQLGCSKGTISYHCGENQKEKTRERKQLSRQGIIKSHKEKKRCLNCNCEMNRRVNTFCSMTCHKEYQYKTVIEKWKSGEFDGTKNGGLLVSGYIRRYLFEKYDGKCSRCGWNTKNPYTNTVILEVEHIDGNSLNNTESNLDLICPNCHSLTSTYKALNYGNGNRDRLKYTKLI